MNNYRMTVKNELNKLSKSDIYSLMLFTLYKLRDIPEYSAISELCYVLDEQNLMALLEFFGGLTIKIPTPKELISLVQSLMVYQEVELNGKDYETALTELNYSNDTVMRHTYLELCEVLKNYNFVLSKQNEDGADV